MSERHFNLRQAETLLPELECLLGAAIDCKKLLDETAREQTSIIERVVRMGGVQINLEHAVALKRRRQQQMERLREQVECIQDYGVLIKDLDMGLIDFPTTIAGREAYLCWKLGEDGIRHWHYTDEGFANRKALDENLTQAARRSPKQ